jgi:hypothetical protein
MSIDQFHSMTQIPLKLLRNHVISNRNAQSCTPSSYFSILAIFNFSSSFISIHPHFFPLGIQNNGVYGCYILWMYRRNIDSSLQQENDERPRRGGPPNDSKLQKRFSPLGSLAPQLQSVLLQPLFPSLSPYDLRCSSRVHSFLHYVFSQPNIFLLGPPTVPH